MSAQEQASRSLLPALDEMDALERLRDIRHHLVNIPPVLVNQATVEAVDKVENHIRDILSRPRAALQPSEGAPAPVSGTSGPDLLTADDVLDGFSESGAWDRLYERVKHKTTGEQLEAFWRAGFADGQVCAPGALVAATEPYGYRNPGIPANTDQPITAAAQEAPAGLVQAATEYVRRREEKEEAKRKGFGVESAKTLALQAYHRLRASLPQSHDYILNASKEDLEEMTRAAGLDPKEEVAWVKEVIQKALKKYAAAPGAAGEPLYNSFEPNPIGYECAKKQAPPSPPPLGVVETAREYVRRREEKEEAKRAGFGVESAKAVALQAYNRLRASLQSEAHQPGTGKEGA